MGLDQGLYEDPTPFEDRSEAIRLDRLERTANRKTLEIANKEFKLLKDPYVKEELCDLESEISRINDTVSYSGKKNSAGIGARKVGETIENYMKRRKLGISDGGNTNSLNQQQPHMYLNENHSAYSPRNPAYSDMKKRQMRARQSSPTDHHDDATSCGVSTTNMTAGGFTNASAKSFISATDVLPGNRLRNRKGRLSDTNFFKSQATYIPSTGLKAGLNDRKSMEAQ